jgi:hypothetical protein
LYQRERTEAGHGILGTMLAQGLFSFALWILYGVIQARRSGAIRESLRRLSRSRRGFVGSGLLLGAMVVLFGGFIGIHALGGFTKDSMTLFGWVMVTVLGLAFVHLQTTGMAMLASLGFENVTGGPSSTSTSPESARKSS